MVLQGAVRGEALRGLALPTVPPSPTTEACKVSTLLHYGGRVNKWGPRRGEFVRLHEPLDRDRRGNRARRRRGRRDGGLCRAPVTAKACRAIGIRLALPLLLAYVACMTLLFGTEALDLEAWRRCVAVGVAVFAVVEPETFALRRPIADSEGGDR
jgi:hypothetical protein